jgi:hypothetical protein
LGDRGTVLVTPSDGQFGQMRQGDGSQLSHLDLKTYKWAGPYRLWGFRRVRK